MADFKGIMLILLNLSNFVVQLATLTVNLIVLSTRKTKKYVIQALNASRKRLKKHLKRLNKRRRRKERICRPGRTNIWWENILANRTCTEDWKENFRMSRRHFFELCERLRPRLTGQNTNMRDTLPVETKVAAILYYLVDESKYRKVR